MYRFINILRINILKKMCTNLALFTRLYSQYIFQMHVVYSAVVSGMILFLLTLPKV